MNESWRGFTKDPREIHYLEGVISNQFFQAVVQRMLDNLLDEEERRETSVSQYDNPSWAYAQADRNGAKRAVRKLSSLLIKKDSPNHG